MINKFENFVHLLAQQTARLAQIALVFAMVIIVANVILRIPWKPLGGTVELVEMAGAILLALGIAHTAVTRGHIMVGVLVDKFPQRIQGFVEIAVNSIAMFFSFLLARELFLYALSMMARGYETGHLKIPISPSIFLVSFGFMMLSLVLLLDLIKAAQKVIKGSQQQ